MRRAVLSTKPQVRLTSDGRIAYAIRVATEDDPRFDPAKDAENVRRHGISLSRYVDLEIFVFLPDERFDYGEERFRAWGAIDGETYCLAFTRRDGRVRPISLRRAHDKEIKRHVR